MSPEQSSGGPDSPLPAADATPPSPVALTSAPADAPADSAATPGAPPATTTPSVGAPAATAAPGMAYPPYAPYPPYSPYSPYPPYPVYPPPPELYQPTPGQPSPAMPAPMSIPLPYGSPFGAYQTYRAPTSASVAPAPINIQARRRSAAWPVVLTVVGSLLVVALVVGGLYALVTVASHAFSQIAPSSTPIGITGYTTLLPGQCDTQHPEYWQNQDNTTTRCTSAALVTTDPGKAKTIAEVMFQPPNLTFPARYTVSVDVTSEANTCAGLTVLRHDYTGYGLYVCPDGLWDWNRYNATGQATTVNDGTVPTTTSYKVEVEVTPHQVSLLINGKNQLTTNYLSSYTTDFLGLAVDGEAKSTTSATADFSNFDYERRDMEANGRLASASDKASE